MRGLSWPPSGPLPPGDGLDAGHADTRRLLKPPPLTAAHHRGVLTPLLAGATAGRERAAPHAASRHGRRAPPPWPVYTAATACLSPRRWSAPAAVAVGAGKHAASRNYSTHDTMPAADVSRPRACITW